MEFFKIKATDIPDNDLAILETSGGIRKPKNFYVMLKNLPVHNKFHMICTAGDYAGVEIIYDDVESQSRLTKTEQKVFEMYLAGKSQQDCSRELGSSLRTIKAHTTNLLRKKMETRVSKMVTNHYRGVR